MSSTTYFEWRPIASSIDLSKTTVAEAETATAEMIYATAYRVVRATNSVPILKASEGLFDDQRDPRSLIYHLRNLGQKKDLVSHEDVYYMTCAKLKWIFKSMRNQIKNGRRESDVISDWAPPDFTNLCPVSIGEFLKTIEEAYEEMVKAQTIVLLDNSLRLKRAEKMEGVLTIEEVPGLEDHRRLEVPLILSRIKEKYEKMRAQERQGLYPDQALAGRRSESAVRPEENPAAESGVEPLLPPRLPLDRLPQWFPRQFVTASPRGHETGDDNGDREKKTKRSRLQEKLEAAKTFLLRKKTKFEPLSGMEQMPSSRPASPFVGLQGEQQEPNSGDLGDSALGLKSTYKSLRPAGLNLSSIMPSGRDPPSPKAPNFDWESFKERDEVYEPDVDQMVDTLTSFAMANPGKSLPANYNSFLLHVLSAHRKMKAELQAEKEGRQRDLESWSAEKTTYEAEVDRLEQLLVACKGLGGLVSARKGSLLRKEGQTDASGQTGQKAIAGHDNSGKEKERGTSRRIRPDTWKQDVRISRLFKSGEGPTTLPYGTVPSDREAVGFGTLYNQQKNRAGLPTSPSAVRPEVAPSSSPKNQDPAERERLLLSRYLDSSSESSETGKERKAALEALKYNTDTPVPAESLTKDTPQPENALEVENERPPTGGVDLPAERTSLHREQENTPTKGTNGRHRGFSFTPGDDAGPSHAQSLLSAHLDGARRIPAGSEVTPKVPAPSSIIGHRVRPHRSSGEKPEQSHSQEITSSPSSAVTVQRVSGDRKEIGRAQTQQAEGRVDFSAIAAARAFSGASSRNSSQSSHTQSKGNDPVPTVGRTSRTITTRRATSGAIDPQGRANRPHGVFPVMSSGAAEGMSITDTSSSLSLRRTEQQAIVSEERKASSQGQQHVRFAFH